MPNICCFTLKAVGEKDAINKLRSYLENDYCYSLRSPEEDPDEANKYKMVFSEEYNGQERYLYTNAQKHFWRVFEISPAYDELTNQPQEEPQKVEGNTYEQIFFGNCAWSVWTCMTNNGYNADADVDNPLVSKHAASLEKVSAELPLKIEVYSSEPAMQFAEHYLFEDGKAVVNEEYQYTEFLKEDYESKQAAEEDLGIKISDQQWEEEDWVVVCDINPADPKWMI